MLIGEVVEKSTVDATLENAELQDSDGIEVTGQYVLPIEGPALGNSTYPPTDLGVWSRRVNLKGAEIPPRTYTNIVLKVKRTSVDPGKSSRIELNYVSSGVGHTTSGTTSYRFADSCS